MQGMAKRCGTIWEMLKANVDHVEILHFCRICQCLSWNRFVHAMRVTPEYLQD